MKNSRLLDLSYPTGEFATFCLVFNVWQSCFFWKKISSKHLFRFDFLPNTFSLKKKKEITFDNNHQSPHHPLLQQIESSAQPERTGLRKRCVQSWKRWSETPRSASRVCVCVCVRVKCRIQDMEDAVKFVQSEVNVLLQFLHSVRSHLFSPPQMSPTHQSQQLRANHPAGLRINKFPFIVKKSEILWSCFFSTSESEHLFFKKIIKTFDVCFFWCVCVWGGGMWLFRHQNSLVSNWSVLHRQFGEMLRCWWMECWNLSDWLIWT